MKKQQIKEIIITTLLCLLFVYAGFSKIADFNGFQRAMHKQPFQGWFINILIWTLPATEITIGVMFIWEKTRIYGLWLFVLLMVVFTFYISAILLHFFPYIPCSCGGLIESLGWRWHLIFNLCFIILAIFSLWQYKQEANSREVN